MCVYVCMWKREKEREEAEENERDTERGITEIYSFDKNEVHGAIQCLLIDKNQSGNKRK